VSKAEIIFRLSASMGIDAIRDSPYIWDCCRVLKESEEYPTDEYLMHLVHLQSVIGKIRLVSLPLSRIDQPLVIYIKMLQNELQQFKDNLPTGFGQNSTLLRSTLIFTLLSSSSDNMLTLIHRKDVLIAQYNSTMVSLFELGFHKSFLTASSP